MNGITIYLDLVRQAKNRLTDEQLGRMFRATLEAAETETMPTFEDPYDDILFDGFRTCLQKGFDCVEKKRKGVNNRWSREKAQNPKLVGEIEPDTKPVIMNQTVKPKESQEVDENKLQLFLGVLQERKPQKNQTLRTLLNMNSSISGFCDSNKINYVTREKAWELYNNEE